MKRAVSGAPGWTIDTCINRVKLIVVKLAQTHFWNLGMNGEGQSPVVRMILVITKKPGSDK